MTVGSYYQPHTPVVLDDHYCLDVAEDNAAGGLITIRTQPSDRRYLGLRPNSLVSLPPDQDGLGRPARLDELWRSRNPINVPRSRNGPSPAHYDGRRTVHAWRTPPAVLKGVANTDLDSTGGTYHAGPGQRITEHASPIVQTNALLLLAIGQRRKYRTAGNRTIQPVTREPNYGPAADPSGWPTGGHCGSTGQDLLLAPPPPPGQTFAAGGDGHYGR